MQLFTINGSALRWQQSENLFEQMIGRHDQLLYKVCRMYAYTDTDRLDLFQEIVLQLWKAIMGWQTFTNLDSL